MTDRTDSPTRHAAGTGVRLACLLLALVLLVAAPVAATAATAQSTDSLPAEPAFVVDLTDDGSARVSLVATFDLTTDSERQAFETLRANETTRDRRTEGFATRMRAIATRAENATGREMAIRDPAMTFTTANDTGVIALSVTWDGLAAQKGDRLVLREPFASGFEIDRPFRVVAPDGYELTTASPPPTTQQSTGATWDAGTQFDGFEAVFVPAAGGTDAGEGATGVGAPGFGIGAAAAAVLAAAAGLGLRRQRR